jgi:hypothetical protein
VSRETRQRDKETKRQRDKERGCIKCDQTKRNEERKKRKKVTRQRDQLREREGGSERETERERGEEEGVGWVSGGGGDLSAAFSFTQLVANGTISRTISMII